MCVKENFPAHVGDDFQSCFRRRGRALSKSKIIFLLLAPVKSFSSSALLNLFSITAGNSRLISNSFIWFKEFTSTYLFWLHKKHSNTFLRYWSIAHVNKPIILAFLNHHRVFIFHQSLSCAKSPSWFLIVRIVAMLRCPSFYSGLSTCEIQRPAF